MSDLQELYQEVILDHNRSPRNFRVPEKLDLDAVGDNPLCGDRVHLFLSLDDEGIVQDACFQGSGCAISTASASIMTEAIQGKSLSEVQQLFDVFHALVTGQAIPTPDFDLGKLAVFHGVSEFPVRVKCATLVWHTMQAALEKKSIPVSTE